MKIVDYYIVYATRIRSLESGVNKRIKDGWLPIGSHAIGYRDDGIFYTQAMVKYDE